MSSNLQNKLSDFQSEPPKGVWENIVAALDEPSSEILSEKLYNFQQTPAPKAWDSIAKALDATPETPVIPIPKKGRSIWTYVAAAAIMGAVALTSLFVLNKTSSDTVSPVAGTEPVQQVPTLPVPSNDTVQRGPVVLDQPSITLSSPQKEERKNMTANPVKKQRSLISSALAGISRPQMPRDIRRQPVNFTRPKDRYMIYNDGSGSRVRLPQKLFEVFSCAQEDIRCQEQIKTLQQRIATKAISSDFTGIMELLTDLQKNR
jgi:hypothetical protein